MELKEYKKLVDTIDYHMNKYYNDDEPEITDFEYDQLMLQLKAAEKEHQSGSPLIRQHRKSVVLQSVKLV